MDELAQAKETLRRLLRKAASQGYGIKKEWTVEDDTELDWAIDQIVRAAAERGRGPIQ